MAQNEGPNHAVLVPVRIIHRRQNEFISFNPTEDVSLVSMNSSQTTTEASVISTARFGQSSFPDDIDFGIQWEDLPSSIIGSGYGHAQDVQVSLSLFRPSHGVLSSSVSDHSPLFAHEQLESQSDSFASQVVDIPIGGEPAQGSLYLHLNGMGQDNARYDSDLDTIRFEGVMQGPSGLSMDSATHTPFSRSDGLESEVPVPECPFEYRQPWSTPFRCETEGPLVAAMQDVPIQRPPPWHVENLVADLSTFDIALNNEPLRLPMVFGNSKSPTCSEFTFASAPLPQRSDEVTNEEPTPSDLPSHNRSRSCQFVWNARTGERIPIRTKRNSTKAERRDSKAIRNLGGQCPKCRKGKRKCDQSHIRGASESSTTSSPASTTSSLGSSWVKAPSPKRQTVKPTYPSPQRHGDHLLPPHLSHRQRVAHAPRPLSADPKPWSEQAIAHYEYERPTPHPQSATTGSESTSMLYINARVGHVDSAMLSGEAGSSTPSISEWDNTPLSQAYVGLGGQFMYAPSGGLH